MAPRGFGTMAAMMICGRIGTKIDVRLQMLVGIALLLASLYWMTLWTPDVSSNWIITVIVIQGAGIGLVFMPLQLIAFATLSPALRGDGAAAMSLTRNIGMAIGTSVTGAIVTQMSQYEHAVLSYFVTPFSHVFTSGAMAAVYDRLMYHGATYADLEKQGLPVVSVEATDIAGGIAFPFTQASFDLLCSDLNSFPVARAVAASAGLPILFSPITVASHRSGCVDYPPPGAPRAEAATEGATLSRASVLARNAKRQMDPDRTKWVHLMDGGISDNLALRVTVECADPVDEDDAEVRRLATITRRVIVISVDGQATRDPTLGQRRVVTGLGQIISAVSGTQIDAYSFETLLLADQQVNELAGTIKHIRCGQGKVLDGHACDDVQSGLIQISLSAIADDAMRRRLQAIPTSLTIPDADVDALVEEGRDQIRSNPMLRELIADFAPSTDAVASTGGVSGPARQ